MSTSQIFISLHHARLTRDACFDPIKNTLADAYSEEDALKKLECICSGADGWRSELSKVVRYLAASPWNDPDRTTRFEQAVLFIYETEHKASLALL